MKLPLNQVQAQTVHFLTSKQKTLLIQYAVNVNSLKRHLFCYFKVAQVR